MKSMGDFGGITYTDADFHTDGQSGLSGISYEPGDYVTPGTSGFGSLGEMSYFDYVTKYKLNAAILFSVGLVSGIIVSKMMKKRR